MIRELSFQKAVAYTFMLSVLLTASNVANSHDETDTLPVICSHKYTSAGQYVFSQVFFSWSKKNLKKHDAINFDVEKGDFFDVVMDLEIASGEVIQNADRKWYWIKDGKFNDSQNWITLDDAETPETIAEMKKRIGNYPKVSCRIILQDLSILELDLISIIYEYKINFEMSMISM